MAPGKNSTFNIDQAIENLRGSTGKKPDFSAQFENGSTYEGFDFLPDESKAPLNDFLERRKTSQDKILAESRRPLDEFMARRGVQMLSTTPRPSSSAQAILNRSQSAATSVQGAQQPSAQAQESITKDDPESLSERIEQEMRARSDRWTIQGQNTKSQTLESESALYGFHHDTRACRINALIYDKYDDLENLKKLLKDKPAPWSKELHRQARASLREVRQEYKDLQKQLTQRLKEIDLDFSRYKELSEELSGPGAARQLFRSFHQAGDSFLNSYANNKIVKGITDVASTGLTLPVVLAAGASLTAAHAPDFHEKRLAPVIGDAQEWISENLGDGQFIIGGKTGEGDIPNLAGLDDDDDENSVPGRAQTRDYVELTPLDHVQWDGTTPRLVTMTVNMPDGEDITVDMRSDVAATIHRAVAESGVSRDQIYRLIPRHFLTSDQGADALFQFSERNFLYALKYHGETLGYNVLGETTETGQRIFHEIPWNIVINDDYTIEDSYSRGIAERLRELPHVRAALAARVNRLPNGLVDTQESVYMDLSQFPSMPDDELVTENLNVNFELLVDEDVQQREDLSTTFPVVRAVEMASDLSGIDRDFLYSILASADAPPEDRQDNLFAMSDRDFLFALSQYGSKYGFGEYANHIQPDLSVDDADMEQDILALRENPVVNAVLTAEGFKIPDRYQIRPDDNQIVTWQAADWSENLPNWYTRSIVDAGNATDIDPGFLVNLTAGESNFETDAAAIRSSARGLGQFIEQTWLYMMHEYGSQYGLDGYSRHIQTGRTHSGHTYYHVENEAIRQAILDLRYNGPINLLMTAEYADHNMDFIVGRGLEATDYTAALSHILGQHDAARYYRACRANPSGQIGNVLSRAELEANFLDPQTTFREFDARIRMLYGTDGSCSGGGAPVRLSHMTPDNVEVNFASDDFSL